MKIEVEVSQEIVDEFGLERLSQLFQNVIQAETARLKNARNDLNSELSDAHKSLLDKRLASFKEHPERMIPWSEVQKNIEQIL